MAASHDKNDGTVATTQHHEVHNDRLEASLKPDEATADAVAKGQLATGFENMTLWQTISTFKIASACCVLAAFSAGADGYQVGMNSSIIANKGFIAQFATEASPAGVKFLSSSYISAWGVGSHGGQIVGQIAVSFVNARLGRKAGFAALWLVVALSIMTEMLARDWAVWLGAKMLAGAGVGMLQATVLGYISEVAPVRIRGGMLMLYSFWWTLGTFFAQVALQRLNATDPTNWLTPVMTQWGHVGVMAIIYAVLPESPAWCASVGKEEKAKKWLRFIHRDVRGYDVDRQYQALALAIEHEKAVAAEQRRESWTAIFRGTDGRRTLTALWAVVAQQFLGLSLFLVFGTYFFQQAGLEDPFKVKVITSSLQIVTVVSSVLLVDRYGRRLMACTATTLMWVSCLVVGILGFIPENSATVYVFILFACFWNIGIAANGAAGWGYVGEISSQRLRPYTSSFAAAANAASGLVMSVLVPYMVNANAWNWRLKTGLFYAGVGLFWTVGAWFVLPETAGRSAAELDELFEGKIRAWRFHKTETATQRLVKAERDTR
ncbi:general substrate transporter [Microdochium trichocladiopsis]|uniref:General substrate transporter n=1 Tax=Microdochium trichocladiopsis TaxID=1682393 RepID=A0A9P8XYT9_9PEZI|nr:general substrate transporter [Microdochium trichocladiopsis]KAH7025669.1 general substrate transporter [Microdochium trichocladiopsis]